MIRNGPSLSEEGLGQLSKAGPLGDFRRGKKSQAYKARRDSLQARHVGAPLPACPVSTRR